MSSDPHVLFESVAIKLLMEREIIGMNFYLSFHDFIQIFSCNPVYPHLSNNKKK